MFGIRKLFLIFVGLCTVIGCNAQHDDFRKLSSDVRSGDSKIADTVSSHYDEYMSPRSDPRILKEHNKPSENRAEDENNTCKKMLHECTMMKNDISNEALSRIIVKMLLSRTHMRSEGSLFWGRVELEATASELEALKNFQLGKLTLREVVPILNNVITIAEFDLAYEGVLFIKSLITIILNFIVTYRNEIFTIVSLSYLYWLLKYVRRGFWGTLFITIQMIITVVILVTWWQVSREVNIEPLPIQCQSAITRSPDKMKAMKHSLECQRYYDAKMKSLPLKDFPKIVLSLALVRIIWIAIEFSQAVGSELLILLCHFIKTYTWTALYCGFAIYFVYVYKRMPMNERTEQVQYRRRYTRR